MKIKSIIGILFGVITYELLRITNSLMSKLYHDILLFNFLLIVLLYSYYNIEIREGLQKKSNFILSSIIIVGLSVFLYFMGNVQTFKFSLLWGVVLIGFLIFLQYKKGSSRID